MSPVELAVVLAAGLGAGVLTSTVGVASLLSFPVLLAVGLPPVVANASNTVGMTPGALSGAVGYRDELRAHPRLSVVVFVACALGAVGGAILLLALRPGVFEAVAPWLILFTCLLVGAQPRISADLRDRAVARGAAWEPRLTMRPITTLATLLTGVYGGYFGAGSGVMAFAVLALGLDVELRVLAGLKTLAIFAGNVVASLIFILLADLAWAAVASLAGGAVIGGYVGARIGRRMPAALLRAGVVVVGVTAALIMLLT